MELSDMLQEYNLQSFEISKIIHVVLPPKKKPISFPPIKLLNPEFKVAEPSY